MPQVRIKLSEMKEIKFRFWKDNKMEYRTLDECCDQLNYESGAVQPYDSVVMQYIGLKDKNGKEIYEGDIVQTDGSVVFSNPTAMRDKIKEITSTEIGFTGVRVGNVFDKEHPSSADNWSNYDLWNISGTLEIIGNIHENKDLLNAPSQNKTIQKT